MTLRIGDEVRHFRLQVLLGGDSAHPVFRGADARTGEPVVVKTFTPGPDVDPELFARFRREVEVYRKLDHPNVVRYLSQGVHEGVNYIVLEYVEGRTVEALLARGRFPMREALATVGQLLRAVEHAHSRGVLHRAIQPSNILVTTDGVVKLLDFGVASADDRLLTSRVGAAVRGSFCYAAPEQNKGRKADERSDLYAVGLVFWELLTGRRAIDADDPLEAVELQHRGPLPPPSSWNGKVSPELDALCGRLLALEPAARFPAAAEVREALRPLQPSRA